MSGFLLVIHISLVTVCSRHPLLEKTLTEKSRRILFWSSLFSCNLFILFLVRCLQKNYNGKMFYRLLSERRKAHKHLKMFSSEVVFFGVKSSERGEDHSTPICEKDDSIVVSRFSHSVDIVVWIREGEVDFFSFTRDLSRSISAFNCCLSVSDSSRSRTISLFSCKFSVCKSL